MALTDAAAFSPTTISRITRSTWPRSGYVKDVDWIENLISVPTDERIFQRWEKIANYVLRHHHLHVYEVHNRLGYLPLLKKFFKLVNIAYAPLYGTVELSEEQIRKYSMKFAPLINPKLTCFVMDENNELVAFGVAGAEHRRGAEKEPRPYLPDRLGGVAACVPRERHARPAAHRRAAGSAEKGCERRHHQQGHEGERQKWASSTRRRDPCSRRTRPSRASGMTSRWSSTSAAAAGSRSCSPRRRRGSPRRPALGQRRDNEKIWKRRSDGSAAFFVLARG